DLPPSVPYYLFGDYIGIFAFRSSLEPKIVLISSPTISSVYKIQFDETWDMADIPPKERKA
ncbi:MAG TPA: hypothetical protein DD400_00675, partial [Rhodospirillaceae bacterium]|nr:hypothetical protein [Rhodospirillaceae bacterium]